jgi:hypothetical protein
MTLQCQFEHPLFLLDAVKLPIYFKPICPMTHDEHPLFLLTLCEELVLSYDTLQPICFRFRREASFNVGACRPINTVHLELRHQLLCCLDGKIYMYASHHMRNLIAQSLFLTQAESNPQLLIYNKFLLCSREQLHSVCINTAHPMGNIIILLSARHSSIYSYIELERQTFPY